MDMVDRRLVHHCIDLGTLSTTIHHRHAKRLRRKRKTEIGFGRGMGFALCMEGMDSQLKSGRYSNIDPSDVVVIRHHCISRFSEDQWGSSGWCELRLMDEKIRFELS